MFTTSALVLVNVQPMGTSPFCDTILGRLVLGFFLHKSYHQQWVWRTITVDLIVRVVSLQ